MQLSHPWDNDSTIFHYPKPGTMGIVPPIGRTISIFPPTPNTVYNGHLNFSTSPVPYNFAQLD